VESAGLQPLRTAVDQQSRTVSDEAAVTRDG
jgi:hypothetical protein